MSADVLFIWKGEKPAEKETKSYPACQQTDTCLNTQMCQFCLATPYQSQPPVDQHIIVNIWTGNNQIAYNVVGGRVVIKPLMLWHTMAVQWHQGLEPSCTWWSIHTSKGTCPIFFVTQFLRAWLLSNCTSNDKMYISQNMQLVCIALQTPS